MDDTGLINKSQAAQKSKRHCSTDQEAGLKKEGDFAPEVRYSSFRFSQVKGVIIQQVHVKLLILACSSN